MPLAITCCGGVNEIGGNKLYVQDRDTRIFLDFGAGFSEGLDYFSSGIEPRSVNGAGDYFEFGLLPEFQGLYSEDALRNTRLRYSKPEIDGIALSHYHYDHMGRINFIDPEIPVYCGETTDLLHQAASESGYSPLNDHPLKTFRTGDRLKIGSLEIEPIHVDHSIPGAYGFLIHTSTGAIAYTGDFRFHGPMGRMTHEFVERASAEEPIALLTEGTRVTKEDSKSRTSEADLMKESEAIVKKAKKLVFSSFRGNDIDRISSFHQVCKREGRTLVVSMKVAMILEKLRQDKHLKVPRIGKDVQVYVRRKSSGKYDDRDYYHWERKFLNDGLTAEMVRKKQKEIFLHLDAWNLPELIDIKPDKGGTYIHASTEAFNEEGEQEEQVVRNWIEHFGFSYHHTHASGHASMEEVGMLVNRINPKRTIPIHTENASLFQSFWKGRLSLPRKGHRIPM